MNWEARRILVVDDDDGVRDTTARALSAAGYSVETACDGDEGLHIAREGRFDLVLSDIRMPLMDGIAMAQALAADRPGQRIVLMTGYAEQRERAAELDGIVRDVISKPFTLAEIRSRVASALA